MVHKIGSHCYHLRGLYPLQDKKAQVVTRYVFGSQSKLVERGLTADEMLQVYDPLMESKVEANSIGCRKSAH